MNFELENYSLLVNPEANEIYYENEQTIFDSDPSDNTKNFELAVSGLPLEVKKLFRAMKVDILKPIEMYVSYETSSMLVYEGYYHVCGEILSGESPWQKCEGSDIATLDETLMYSIGNNFKCGFSKECTLLFDEFPRPCFQMEVVIALPQVIA